MPLNLNLENSDISINENYRYNRSNNKSVILEHTGELYNRLEKNKYDFFNNIINSEDINSYSKFVDVINYIFSESIIYLKNSINKNTVIMVNMTLNNYEKINEFINNIDNRHNCIEYYKNNIIDKESSFTDIMLFNEKDIQYIFNDILTNTNTQQCSDFESFAENIVNRYFGFSKNIESPEEFLEYIYQYPEICKLFKNICIEINTQFIEVRERIISTIINCENINIEEFIIYHKKKISETIVVMVSLIIVVDNILDNFLKYFNTVSMVVDNILDNTTNSTGETLASKEDLLRGDEYSEELEESFSNFYISSYNNDGIYSKLSYYSELAILLEDGENKSSSGSIGDKIKDRISKTIASITEMVNKFLSNLNQFMGVDKGWFDNNKDRIMKNNFPNSEGDFDDWYDYKVSDLQNAVNLPKFDTNNQELMNALSSDKEFEEFIISKRIIPDIPNSANDKSFKEKCKASYMGDIVAKKNIKQVESMKKDMLDYCLDYVEGKNSKVYQGIQNQIKNIDDSKKIIDKAVATDNAAQQQNTTQNNNTTDNSSQSQSSNNNSQSQNNNSSKNESLLYPDIPGILGLSESTNVLYELKTPKIDKDSKPGSSNMKEKGNRYISMCGVILGAKMTVSLKVYNDYKRVLKWAYGE